jgi:hypothetical protein
VSQLAASHNSRPLSSQKSAENSPLSVENPRARALQLANDLVRKVGMTPTWPNIQTVRLAIRGEAEFSEISMEQAASVIGMAAKEWSRGRYITCTPAWEERELYRINTIDRFWFEDARWRNKNIYAEFMAQLQESVSP